MRLLTPEHLATLTDPQTWRDNPFADRSRRCDRKRHQPLRSILVMLTVITTLVLLALWGANRVHALDNGVPWFLGGSYAALLLIVVSGIHAWFVFGAAQKHTTALLTQEQFRNTLPGLLMLPTSPFRLLVQTSAYPWLAGMRMAVVLLPFYAVCVGMGGASVFDILMLYVVFALLALASPVWRTPALGDPTPAAMPTATLKKSGANPNVKASNNSTSGGLFALVMVAPFLILVATIVGGQSTGLASFQTILRPYLSDALITLLPSSLLSWPLLFARALVTPFDWFGLPVPPLGFALVLTLLGRYANLVRSSEYLAVGTYRDLAKTPTFLSRRSLERALGIAATFVLTGYVWRLGVTSGALSALVGAWERSPNGGYHIGQNAVQGLLGFAYLLAFITIWRGFHRAGLVAQWLNAARPAPGATVVRRLTWATTARYLAEPFVVTIGFYLACCLVARTAPFSLPLLTLMGKMAVIGLGGMLLNFGARRVFGANASLLGMALTMLWAYGWLIKSQPQAYPLFLFSPTAGLISLGPLRLLATLFNLANGADSGSHTRIILGQLLPAWWKWGVDGALLGGLLSTGVWFASMRVRRTAGEADTPTLDPAIVGEEPFADAVVSSQEKSARLETPLALELIKRVQRVSDNAVAIRELRARLRGKLSPRLLQSAFGLYLILTVAGVTLPLIPHTLMGGAARALFGTATDAGAQTLAEILCAFYAGLIVMAFPIGLNTLLSFAVEREKSTLGFLLMTPMRARSIVAGKAVGLLASGGLAGLTVAVWTFALSVALLPAFGLQPLVVWFEAVVTATVLMATVGMGLLAFASLFPRLVTVASAGVLGMVVFQVGVQATVHTSRYWGPMLMNIIAVTNLSGYGMWLSSLGACVALTGLTTLLATWGVRRMRKGDIAFAASKREN